MDWQRVWETMSTQLTTFGLKVAGAIAVWIIGRWLIGLASRLLARALERQGVDSTLRRYIANIVTVALNIVRLEPYAPLMGAFAALIAAMGIAIGAAWAGLLANFAAGAFLIILRPFQVGNYVKAGGTEGTVKEIGLFATTIMTPDNVMTFVGNNKIFSDTIQNFSASPYRRVDRLAQLAHGVDAADARRRLKEALARIPNVAPEPAPDVEIVDFNERGAVLAVRPYTHTDHYWQVYFDTNKAISDAFGAAGYPVPESHVQMRQAAA